MLKENEKYIKMMYPDILSFLQANEQELKNYSYFVEETKIGLPTIRILQNNSSLYLHSKYDPKKEAERIVEMYQNNITDDTHIIFYGAGFFYHIDQFNEKFPNLTYSVYEPNPAIFFHYLSNRSLQQHSRSNLKNIYLEGSREMLHHYLHHFASSIVKQVLLIPLPSYERAFADQYNDFMNTFKEVVQSKRLSFGADVQFSTRWTLNSLMNLPTTISTPNLIIEKKEKFQGKPVLIVSAGPSLHYELDNLKYIKENGLAYIFAVGSANKALIANNILPDAVFTYDPQEHNFTVFKDIIEKNITSIPMVYGTSVGYETIQKYPGPKLHVITSQDKVTPYYIENFERDNVVNDAFSIAIVTLEVMAKLEAGLVILVGQNFAFKDNLYYAEDIKRGNKKGAELQESDRKEIVSIKDVYGNAIETNVTLNQMRLLMEQYIHHFDHLEVVNTTNGGAHINGAKYISLENVIKERLKEKIVEDDWYLSKDNSKIENRISAQIIKMNHSMNNFIQLFKEVITTLNELGFAIERNRVDKINSLFPKFDKWLNKLLGNDFYSVYVGPITRVHFELLQKNIIEIKEEIDLRKKAAKVIKYFGSYLQICRQVYNSMNPIVKNTVHAPIQSIEKVEKWKRYNSCSGEFSYSKGVLKKDFKIEKKYNRAGEILCTFHESHQKGETISFKFIGTSIRILGGKSASGSSKVKITIDGYHDKFSSKDIRIDEQFSVNFQEILYENSQLKDTIHNVEITLTEDLPFVFQGIEINSNGRLLHIDEVTDMKELQVGKRIRCHLGSDIKDGIAQIINIGEETDQLISNRTDELKGDFYLIKVFEDQAGNSKFVYDSNLGIIKVLYSVNNKKFDIILNKIPMMSTNKTENGKASSSSSHTNVTSNWHAYKAFNKKASGIPNAWATTKGVTQGWIKYEFNNPVVLNCYTMVNQDSEHTQFDTKKRMPKNWVVEGWDGDKWLILDERFGITDWLDKCKKYFTFANNKAFKSYRIFISDNNGDSEFLAIGEIQFV